MEQYKNLGGNSGVHAYEVGNDFVKIQFRTGAVYLYTYQSAGSNNIEEMKKLAPTGAGLNSFIMLNVKFKYARKL